MTTTCFEVRDARGRNVGDCFDGSAEKAIDRAIAMTDAITGLGPLTILRLEQHVVVHTVREDAVGVIGGNTVQTNALMATLRELRAARQSSERLAA